MKKIVLTLAAAFTLTAVQAQDKLTMAVATDDDTETATITHFLYNADGDKVYALVQNVADTTFTYNEAHQLTRKQYRVLSAPDSYRAVEYTYNDLGQVATETEFIGTRNNGTTTYTYDAHGNVASFVNSRTSMPISYKNTYDDAGHLILQEVLHPMTGTAMNATEYIYEDDILVRMSVSSQGVISFTTAFTYNDAGVLTHTSTYNVQTAITTTTLFSYSDIDASYVPQDVQAIANPGNTVTLTWTGKATGIAYNGDIAWFRSGMDATSFTTEVLKDGTYTFYVINSGNAAVVSEVTVFDDTKVGVSDVHLIGDIYTSVIQQTDYYGEVKEVTAYNIPIAWSLPEGSAPDSYRIYYNTTYYVDVPDGTLREFVIPATSTSAWSMSQGEYTLPFDIRVIAIYPTGEVEPQNHITFTLEETQGIITAVQQTRAQHTAATELFSLDGIRLNAAPRKGTYIMRQGDSVRKIQVK